MNEYVLGIDGGGTKTAVCVLPISGGNPYIFTQEGLNTYSIPSQEIEATLTSILKEVKRYTNDLTRCRAVCIASAGSSNLCGKVLLESVMRRELGHAVPIFVISDAEAAFSCSFEEPVGIVLIAGTGSCCYGKNYKGEVFQTGGDGHLLGDEGSGYSAGKYVLKAVLHQWNFQRETTILTPLLGTMMGLMDRQSVLKFVYDCSDSKAKIAKLAPLLDRACQMEDRVAIGIAKNLGRELVVLCRPVLDALRPSDRRLALYGGFIRKCSAVRTSFLSSLQEDYTEIPVFTPSRTAEEGAAIVALKYISNL